MRSAIRNCSALITSKIGRGWITDEDELRKLEPFADDPAFRKNWREVKQTRKLKLAALD